MNPRVYLLARLVNQSETKFKMWCKYHDTCGFRKIYVFASEEPSWFHTAKTEITTASERFVFIKSDSRWKKVSEMVKAFCKHCGNGDWGMILGTDEYIFSEKGSKFKVGHLVGYAIQRRHARAVTIYKEYVKEAEDVGFKAKDYFSYTTEDAKFPVSSTLLFSVQDVTRNPLSSPFTPVQQEQWVDTSWCPLNREILMNSVPRFSDCSVRVIKLLDADAVDDESAASFTIPATGFMAYLLYRFPELKEKIFKRKGKVDAEVEENIRKNEEDAKKSVVPADENLEYNLDGELVGRVISHILMGTPYPTVLEDIHDLKLPVSDEAVKIVYDRECYNIVDGNGQYRRLVQLMSDGAKSPAIMRELHVSPKSLKKMRTMIESMPPEIKARFVTETVVETGNKDSSDAPMSSGLPVEEIPTATPDE